MNDLKIIFEDNDILVLDKEAGIVVNRAQTVHDETLQDQLAEYLSLGSGLGIGGRAGIVHRLDRETSGLMVVAKAQGVYDNLLAQFAERKIKKEYVALVHGKIVQDYGTIEAPIGRVGGYGKFGTVLGGRPSRTDFEVSGRCNLKDAVLEGLMEEEGKNRKNYFKNHARFYTQVLAHPLSGRTHQVRVHLKSIGYPLVSDSIYAPTKLLKLDLRWCPRLFLHAKSLEFTHPGTKKAIFFESELPEDLKNVLENLASC
ncbi:MAG: RluA family pseudouridine synthase [Candidatus Curtissbacteria bacterium]